MRKVQQQQPLASTSNNNNYQFSQQLFVQPFPNYYRAQPSQFISNSFYNQPTNSGPVYNMPATQYHNPSMVTYGNPTSRFSPSKIQKPKKTSPVMNRYLSPKSLSNTCVMNNVFHPNSQQTISNNSVPTVIYTNNNSVQYPNSQPQQTFVKQNYKGGMKSSTSIPSINTTTHNRNNTNSNNSQPIMTTKTSQPQQPYQHRYPANSNQNMAVQPINQHKNYAATAKPLMRQQQTVTRNPQTHSNSMYSNTTTTANNNQVHKHYHHHYPANTSEKTIVHHVLNANNTSVNSSISSIGSATSNVSRLSANTSILSNMSDVSEHDYLSEQRQMTQTSGSTLESRTRSWSSFTPTSSQPSNNYHVSNPSEKKTEVVERKPAKALEPTMVEHDDQESTYKTLSQNRSAAWMWSPTKIQRAQERTKRQIMSVLLSPSSSEDDEDEEIFAKIQQRYNEATLRINSIINSAIPPSNTNNKHDACMQTEESIFQNTRPAPKKAPQLSDSHDSDSVRSRPTVFKSQTLSSSIQQQKDKIDSFYLPPIVFPPSLSEDMDFNIDSIRRSSQKQESNHSLSSSSSSECTMFSPIKNASKATQPVSISGGNNRYIVDSMINSVLDEELKDDEDMVLYDDFDSEASTSSIGFGDCSLSSFGSPCSVGKIDLSLSPDGVLSNSDEMKRMVEKEIFLSRNKPKDRIKFSEDTVEIFSYRQSRQVSTVSLVSHCINQIFLNGSPETTLFLERMITIVCDRADIDFRCALSALFFMVKLQNPTFITDENNYNLINEFQRKSAFGNIEPSNFIYTFFVCLMVSSKINEDNYYNNKTFFKYMAVNEFKQIFHAFNLDNAFNYMNDMSLLMVKEDGSVPVQQVLSCSERVHSQALANERYKKYFQQFNITEVNITMALKYDVIVKEESLCNFLDKLERVNESLLIC